MATLNTVVLIEKSKSGKAVIVDSINSFKSTVAQGYIHLSTNIPAEWVNMVLADNPKAVEAIQASLLKPKNECLKGHYLISEDGKSVIVSDSAKASFSLNQHLLTLRMLEVLEFEPIFTSTVDSKPLTYGSEIGYMVRPKN